MLYTVGCDPELFLKKGGEYISPLGIVPGEKENPHKVPQGAVQVDGMAAEFNTEPAKSRADFALKIKTVRRYLDGMLPKGVKSVVDPIAHFPEGYISGLPEEAQRIGCDPDLDAYDMVMNDPADVPENVRTAGGHIHVGWRDDGDPLEEEHVYRCSAVVKQMDCLLGINSVALDPFHQRRLIYGKAGCFRPKPYGVEYRVLSNFWLKDHVDWAYSGTILAVGLLERHVKLFEDYGDSVRIAINTNDVEASRALTQEIIQRVR